MFSKPHKALYVDQDCQIHVRDDISLGEPEENELLIENLYSGVNVADVQHAAQLNIRSTVIGYDFCGRVVSAPSASKFSKGELVAGYTPSGMGRPLKYGTHQGYFICPENMAYKVPLNLTESHAAGLTTVAMTAADVIYNFFKFPLPGSSTSNELSGPVLIWGASTGVGICALQFARASGCQNIFVTASPARHELLKSLGATHCFDYSSPTIVTDIKEAVNALGQGPTRYALDAAGKFSNPSSADLVAQCITDPTAILVSVVFREDKRFRLPVALTKDEWRVQPPGAPQIVTIPPRVEDHWHAWRAVQWAIENYGTSFKLPSVHVFEGTAEEVLREVIAAAKGERGFGRMIIQHPMK